MPSLSSQKVFAHWKIEELCKDSGLILWQLADRLATEFPGTTSSWLNNLVAYSKGGKTPQVLTVARIAKVLGVEVTDFYV